jgi:hypothetical protein
MATPNMGLPKTAGSITVEIPYRQIPDPGTNLVAFHASLENATKYGMNRGDFLPKTEPCPYPSPA